MADERTRLTAAELKTIEEFAEQVLPEDTGREEDIAIVTADTLRANDWVGLSGRMAFRLVNELSEIGRLHGLIQRAVGTPPSPGSRLEDNCPRQDGRCHYCGVDLEVHRGPEPHAPTCPWPELLKEAQGG